MKLWAHFILVVFGFLFLVSGFILKQKFPSFMNKQLEKKLIIREDSPTLQNFISPPIPIYMEFNFFNVTNPDEILKGAKPKVDEIGPYIYLEKRHKHDLNWSVSTVEYLDKTTFIFQPSKSGRLTEDDLITTLNPVLITLLAKLDKLNIADVWHGLFEVYKQRFSVKSFITKKAGELLFKGYDEQMLLELSKITKNPIHENGKFGFFYAKNGSDGGKYSIYTGVDGLETLQVIDTWKDSSRLNYWPDNYCNMINGTTGGQFPQPIVPEQNISMFSADLCRSLYLSFEKKRSHGGLELLRYTLPYEVLSNRSENECYCSDDFTCKSSLIDLSPCRDGAPIIASTPHFYMGDEDIVMAVDGLKPNKELHETYLDIEPNTGVSFKAAKRIQISMLLKRYADLPELKEVTEVILPIFWLDENVEVPKSRAEQLHAKLTRPAIIVEYICYGLFTLGILLFVLPIASFVKSKMDEKKRKTTVQPGEDKPLRAQDKSH